MKTQTILRTALIAGMVAGAGACADGLTEANENPNAPTDVGAQFLLPQAIRSGVERTFGAGLHLSHTAIFPQHAVQIQYPEEEQGNVRSDGMQGIWDGFYAVELKDIQLVIAKGQEAGRPNIEGVGLIWKSWAFHIVTDLWGDIPYSEALRGEEGLTTPVYDMQRDVYLGLIQSLEDGVAMLDAAGAGFGSGDILYDNDFDKWRRFANSLRMRLAMRLSEVDEATARAEFQAAYTAGPFLSNADNAMLYWPGAPYENPLFENWQGRDDHGISETMVEKLKELADPRLALYAEPASQDGEYRGLRNHVAQPELSLAWYSRIGNLWRADGAATPTPIMTYGEVLLLAAEAANRGWIAGDPGALYAEGIRASMNLYDAQAPENNPTDAAIDAYLALPAIAYNPAGGLAQIQLQQWLALFMNGGEAWSNWRRTGVPTLTIGPDLNIPGIAVRLPYPSNEQSLNATNLNAALQRQGGGLDLVTPLWWQGN
jgi:hypothetical protein